MKIKEGFLLRYFNEKYIVVSVDEKRNEFNGIITLNKTAAFVWEQLEKETDYATVIAAITNKYAVDENDAKKDLDSFLQSVRQANLINE